MSDKKLIVDPLLPWDGGHPYRILAHLGVTPESSGAAVLDASYEMSRADRRDHDVNRAWQSLRTAPARLAIDLFCCALPAAPAALPAVGREAPAGLPHALLAALAGTLPDLPEPPRGSAGRGEPPRTLHAARPPWDVAGTDERTPDAAAAGRREEG